MVFEVLNMELSHLLQCFLTEEVIGVELSDTYTRVRYKSLKNVRQSLSVCFCIIIYFLNSFLLKKH